MEADNTNKLHSGNLILVGLMGSGKTTVGKILAKQLNKTFVDCDEEIQRRTGVTINHIFDVEGEVGFRQRETAALEELTQRNNIVLATGGGAPLSEANRELLKRSGIIVYLKSNVHDLWFRTRHDQSRPLLRTADPRATLQALYEKRDPIYNSIADIVIHTGKQNVQILVSKLQEVLASYQARRQADSRKNSAMQTLNVGLGERSYPIYLGGGLLERCELLLPYLKAGRAVIISNTTVAPLYLEKLKTGLEGNEILCESVILPDGEKFKNSATMDAIYESLLKAHCERSTPLIALGGGVVGDMVGFAAASYLRGVPFIQIPTTLLSQVDSSVGGKTGINHPLGKNMIGAFYQPQMVLADIQTLDTLPDRELSAGIAEVIKYGLIRDLPFFEWLEQNIEKLLARDTEALQYAIARSCQNKAEVVGNDERESGERALLNLGHTFGHAIENGMGYGAWLHGEAVAAGTVMAVELSKKMGWLSATDVERVVGLFRRSKLPVKGPHMSVEKFQELMGLDKKVSSGKIRYVLLKALGRAVMTADVDEVQLKETLRACCD